MFEGAKAKTIWDDSVAELKRSLSMWTATPDVAFRSIYAAGELLTKALREGSMIFIAGNGGSAAQAQHFSAEIVGRYMKARPGLPAMALTADSAIVTAIANDFGYDEVFSRQLEAYAAQEDVLVVFSTSGNSPNILQAIGRAKMLGMKIVAIIGNKPSKIREEDCDVLLRMPSASTPRIQELHLFVTHVLCEIIEETM